ncbi:MAG: diaminopimelate epimerase [Gemmatimonadaceae bacterium]
MRSGRRFYKMSGSGNDFIFFDEDDGPIDVYRSAIAIESLCAHGTGVGADGVVFFDRPDNGQLTIAYYNSDGSLGELCGNATLCAVRLAELLGTTAVGDLRIRTDSGEVAGRLIDGVPEIDLKPVTEVAPDWSEIPTEGSESRLGFALVGVPHVTIEVPDISTADVIVRGSEVRRHRSLAHGANVNFVARGPDGRWRIRTYERGVEGETLACGTGAVASAVLLASWGRADSPVRLVTKSSRELTVTLRRDGEAWYPSLRGNAELVFTGELPSGPPATGSRLPATG